MKQVTLLSISNSFGVNLQTYPHQIAKENGKSFEIYVLYIPGCTLQRHTENIKNNSKVYDLYHNGKLEKSNVSILEVLTMRTWDYVITQQVSHLSPYYDTYFPYLNKVINFVKGNGKYSFLGLQETWEYSTAYWKDKDNRFTKEDSSEMYKKVSEVYNRVASELNLKLFKSGDVIHEANSFFNKEFQCEDGFHLSKEGCYLIGLNLVQQIFNEKITKTFVPQEFEKETAEKLVNFISR